MGKVNHVYVRFAVIVTEEEGTGVEVVDALGFEPSLDLSERVEERVDRLNGNARRGVLVDEHFEHWETEETNMLTLRS